MNEIKVAYLTTNGWLSKAYVSEEPPHVGIDKYTDEPVELVWDGQVWNLVEENR